MTVRPSWGKAGISIAGGHTVDDVEPKFGLAVTGIVDPARLLTNAGSRPGDVLVLTKPIGSGIIATAIKRGEASEEIIASAIDSMATLNDTAAAAPARSGHGAGR